MTEHQNGRRITSQRNLERAGKVGSATWLGLLIGTAVKVVLVFAMLGVFAAALVL